MKLVIALLAYKYGLTPAEVFSALVAMATITALTFPFVVGREIKKTLKSWKWIPKKVCPNE